MNKEQKEWVVSSTKDKEPEKLSEIGILTNDDVFTLDQIVGKDFDVELTKLNFEGPHWDGFVKKIVLKTIDDTLVLFHEVGHAVIEEEGGDRLTKKISGKIEAKIRTGEDIGGFNQEEIAELIRIRAERLASAYALRKIRQVKQEKGINLLEGQNFDQVKSRIQYGFSSHFRQIKDTKEYKEKLSELIRSLGLNNKKT